MAAIQCTTAEICRVLGRGETTLNDACKAEKGMTLGEYLEQFRGLGQMSLRRKQWTTAMKGNVTMQRWLGIQYLGQSPKVVMLHKVPGATGGDLPAPEKKADPDGFQIDGLTDMDEVPDKVAEGIQEANVIVAEGRTVED